MCKSVFLLTCERSLPFLQQLNNLNTQQGEEAGSSCCPRLGTTSNYLLRCFISFYVFVMTKKMYCKCSYLIFTIFYFSLQTTSAELKKTNKKTHIWSWSGLRTASREEEIKQPHYSEVKEINIWKAYRVVLFNRCGCFANLEWRENSLWDGSHHPKWINQNKPVTCWWEDALHRKNQKPIFTLYQSEFWVKKETQTETKNKLFFHFEQRINHLQWSLTII